MLSGLGNSLKKFDLFDIKLLQLAAMCIAIILVKIFPVLLEVKVGVYLGLAFLFAVRPVIKLLSK